MAFVIGFAETTANVDASGTWSTAGVQTQISLAMIPADSHISVSRIGIGVIIDTNTTYTAPTSGRRRGFMSAVP